jgi:hypothetical protein
MTYIAPLAADAPLIGKNPAASKAACRILRVLLDKSRNIKPNDPTAKRPHALKLVHCLIRARYYAHANTIGKSRISP